MIEKFNKFIAVVALFAFFLLLVEVSPYLSRFSGLISSLNLIILGLFIADVLLQFFSSKKKALFVKTNWFDLIVFVPLFQFIQGIESTPFFVISRQVVIVVMLLSRSRRAHRLLSAISLKPAQLLVTSFAFAITVGAILLMLPVSSAGDTHTSLIDAFFTATSATCVTGLIVRDTATQFSRFGQSVILFLIQIGGLGIMTFSVSLALLFRKRVDMKQQRVMQDVLDNQTLSGVKKLILFIFKMTFLIEAAGAIILFWAWRGSFSNVWERMYHALFHSVSAFCNAGFSTFSNSLMGFSSDLATNLVICALIIMGGLGFVVIKDLGAVLKNKLDRRIKRNYRLKVQTGIVLKMTAFLVLAGLALTYLLEGNRLFAQDPLRLKLLFSFFQSVTTRTAGFNTCDIARLSAPTVFLFIILMFIGASPGSTGGGVKTTTVAVLWSAVASALRQKENAEIGRRTIPKDIIFKALTVFIFSLGLVLIFGLVLLYTEGKDFADVLFETVSAFGTVGLSRGITPSLTYSGKIIIMLLMFFGRIGPLTVAYAFARYKPANYVYAEERVLIG